MKVGSSRSQKALILVGRQGEFLESSRCGKTGVSDDNIAIVAGQL
jgi:hypothetical protein